ncbi:hypothetical protein IAU60_006165 [Kwoniella sp. DSM 27419]
MIAPRTARPALRAWRRSPARFLRAMFSDDHGPKDPSIMLREIMRNVAQPVAIAVGAVPPSSPMYGKAKYHGATLTSFTSLTLHPHPLVAFSLRLPSRMADCLRPWRTHSDHTSREAARSPSPTRIEQDEPIRRRPIPATATPGITLPPKKDLPWPLSKLPMPEQPPQWAQSLFSQIPNPLATPTPNPLSLDSPPDPRPAHRPDSLANLDYASPSRTPMPIPSATLAPHPTPLTISLLSTHNETTADDLASPRTDHSSIFSLPDTWSEHDTHPPSLLRSLGALRCEVVGSVLLKDLCGSAVPPAPAGQQGSEMFICRVVDVEMPSEKDTVALEPLLHWRRKYVGVKEAAAADATA